MTQKNGPLFRRKRLRTVISVILTLTVVTAVGVFGYTQYLLGAMSRDPDAGLETVSESQLLEEMGEAEGLLQTDTHEEIIVRLGNTNAEVINILLIGQDRRPGQKTVARSDAMILCTVNQAQKTVTLTSFMRDMYVPIPGKKSNRLNAAYAMGGTKLLNQCIENNFGITIHGNVVVDFAACTEAIDLVGGVDVAVTAKEAEYLNTVTYRDQDRWKTGFSEGINHLDGNQALAYARIRKISGNDFGRTNRQRKVLTALMGKAKELTLPQIHRLLKDLLGQVATDMTNGQIWGYAMELLPNLKSFRIESQQIPANGAYRSTTVRGMQVLVPDMEKNRDILEKIVS